MDIAVKVELIEPNQFDVWINHIKIVLSNQKKNLENKLCVEQWKYSQIQTSLKLSFQHFFGKTLDIFSNAVLKKWLLVLKQSLENKLFTFLINNIWTNLINHIFWIISDKMYLHSEQPDISPFSMLVGIGFGQPSESQMKVCWPQIQISALIKFNLGCSCRWFQKGFRSASWNSILCVLNLIQSLI